MRSGTHSVVAAQRGSQFAQFMRRRPYGSWRVKCVSREPRCATATESVSRRVSEQLSLESCSEMHLETHSIVTAPHMLPKRAPHASTAM
eukprot:10067163-Lingulodinium_polyedra.AAC.1